jgi:hypothetical protein
MTVRQIERISGVADPAARKYLDQIRSSLNDLVGTGQNRAIRYIDFSPGTFVTERRTGKIQIPFVESIEPIITRRIEQLTATQTDVSTLAADIFDSSRFGSLLAGKLSDVKTLKVNVNNHIAGYGVAVYGGAEGPTTSDFIIQADRFAVVFPNPEWTPSTGFTQGQYVSPTPAAGVGNIIFEKTNAGAGTTGATEPSWDATPGNTTNDNDIVWTARTIDERVPFVVGNINGSAAVGIEGDLIVDGSITAKSIAALTITADKIAAQTITANEIAAGTITANEIAANTITASEIAAGTITASELAASLVLSQIIELTTDGHIRSGQTDFNTGIGFWLSANSGTPQFSIGDPAGHFLTWNGSVLNVNGNLSGVISVGDLPLAASGWTFDGAFSAVDDDTVAWASGTFTSSNGDDYSITGGNTGNMVARTYIYLDIDTSTTAFQTSTTATDAIGSNKVLIAVAEDGATEPFFQVFGGAGGINGLSFAELEGTLNLDNQVSGTLSTSFAEAGLINSGITINADGTLSGAGSGQVSLVSLPGTIASGQIAANAVIAGKIAALSITAAEIAASTITGSKIAAATIVASNIATNTITANEIATNAITANELAANSVIAAKIAAGAVEADKIATNAITAVKISAGAITSDKLNSAIVYAGDIEIDTGGSIRSGQTAYDTGDGWFLGDDGGEPAFSMRDGSQYLRFKPSLGSLQLSEAALQFTNGTFTPSGYTGFSSNPTGSISYIDFGSLVLLFIAGASHTGTSGGANSNQFVISGLPSALQPSGIREAKVLAINASVAIDAKVQIFSNLSFEVSVGSDGGNILYSATSWNGAGSKGWLRGAVIVYPK